MNKDIIDYFIMNCFSSGYKLNKLNKYNSMNIDALEKRLKEETSIESKQIEDSLTSTSGIIHSDNYKNDIFIHGIQILQQNHDKMMQIIKNDSKIKSIMDTVDMMYSLGYDDYRERCPGDTEKMEDMTSEIKLAQDNALHIILESDTHKEDINILMSLEKEMIQLKTHFESIKKELDIIYKSPIYPWTNVNRRISLGNECRNVGTLLNYLNSLIKKIKYQLGFMKHY